MPRPYPEDTPKRATRWRRGIVRARVAGTSTDGYTYIVDFPPLGTEMAYSLRRFDKNDEVHCQWRNESGTWWIPTFTPPFVVIQGPLYELVQETVPEGSDSVARGFTDARFFPFEPIVAQGPYFRGAGRNDLHVNNDALLVSRPGSTFNPDPLFSVIPISRGGFGLPIHSPTLTVPGVSTMQEALFSPDGSWIAVSIRRVNPTPIPTNAQVHAWNGTAIGTAIDAPVVSAAQGIAPSLHWHPAGSHLACGAGEVVEWSAGAFGAVIGSGPGFRETDDVFRSSNIFAWSRSGNAAVYHSDNNYPTATLTGAPWTGSGWGTEHPYYSSMLGGIIPDEIIFSLDNTKIYLRSGSGAWSHHWTDANGIGALIDTLPAFELPVGQSDLSPDGAAIAVGIAVVPWNQDGTFGDVVFHSGVNAFNFIGTQWYPPNYSPT